MKILMIDTPYRLVYGPLKSVFSRHPSQGIMSISSVLKKAGHDVKVIDPEIEGLREDGISTILKKFDPDIVGISAMTSNILISYEILKLVKLVNPEIFTIAGGYHVTALPDRTLDECKELDAVCVGEGEHTMLELADDSDISKIKGLSYRKNESVINNEPRPIIENLDDLPLPDIDCLPLERYHPHLHKVKSRKWTTIITSRGCPYGCYYCASRIINMGKFRTHSVNRVMETIHRLVDRGFTYLRIFDDEFTIDRARVMAICDRIIDENLDILWDCNSRVNNVDKKLLEKMKQAGCALIFYGCESGNQEILNKMNKQITVEQIMRAFEITLGVGIEASASWIIGNVWDTKETVEDTIKLAKKLIPYSTQHYFNFALPSPGTGFWNIAVEQKRECYDWGRYTLQNEPVYIPANMTSGELMSLMRKAHMEVFYSPRFIWNRLIQMRSFDELKANIKGFLTLNRAIGKWNFNQDECSANKSS